MNELIGAPVRAVVVCPVYDHVTKTLSSWCQEWFLNGRGRRFRDCRIVTGGNISREEIIGVVRRERGSVMLIYLGHGDEGGFVRRKEGLLSVTGARILSAKDFEGGKDVHILAFCCFSGRAFLPGFCEAPYSFLGFLGRVSLYLDGYDIQWRELIFSPVSMFRACFNVKSRDCILYGLEAMKRLFSKLARADPRARLHLMAVLKNLEEGDIVLVSECSREVSAEKA